MIKPMLCHDPKVRDGQPCDWLPTENGWIMEKKQDGWRFLFHVTENGVKSFAGRNGSDRTGQPARIEKALAFLPADTLLDAELIVPGQPSPRVSHELAHGGDNLQAHVFDILRVGGQDVTGLPWSERRALLEKAAEGFDGETVLITEAHQPDAELLESWLAEGGEGAVCKRTDSIYRPGARSREWPKIKPQMTCEAIVIGFQEGNGALAGEVGAFEIRLLDSEVETTCNTGTDENRAAIKSDPADWLGKVIEVRHHGVMTSGKLRHPVFSHKRPDRDPVTA